MLIHTEYNIQRSEKKCAIIKILNVYDLSPQNAMTE